MIVLVSSGRTIMMKSRIKIQKEDIQLVYFDTYVYIKSRKPVSSDLVVTVQFVADKESDNYDGVGLGSNDPFLTFTLSEGSTRSNTEVIDVPGEFRDMRIVSGNAEKFNIVYNNWTGYKDPVTHTGEKNPQEVF